MVSLLLIEVYLRSQASSIELFPLQGLLQTQGLYLLVSDSLLIGLRSMKHLSRRDFNLVNLLRLNQRLVDHFERVVLPLNLFHDDFLRLFAGDGLEVEFLAESGLTLQDLHFMPEVHNLLGLLLESVLGRLLRGVLLHCLESDFGETGRVARSFDGLQTVGGVVLGEIIFGVKGVLLEFGVPHFRLDVLGETGHLFLEDLETGVFVLVELLSELVDQIGVALRGLNDLGENVVLQNDVGRLDLHAIGKLQLKEVALLLLYGVVLDLLKVALLYVFPDEKGKRRVLERVLDDQEVHEFETKAEDVHFHVVQHDQIGLLDQEIEHEAQSDHDFNVVLGVPGVTLEKREVGKLYPPLNHLRPSLSPPFPLVESIEEDEKLQSLLPQRLRLHCLQTEKTLGVVKAGLERTLNFVPIEPQGENSILQQKESLKRGFLVAQSEGKDLLQGVLQESEWWRIHYF